MKASESSRYAIRLLEVVVNMRKLQKVHSHWHTNIIRPIIWALRMVCPAFYTCYFSHRGTVRMRNALYDYTRKLEMLLKKPSTYS